MQKRKSLPSPPPFTDSQLGELSTKKKSAYVPPKIKVIKLCEPMGLILTSGNDPNNPTNPNTPKVEKQQEKKEELTGKSTEEDSWGIFQD